MELMEVFSGLAFDCSEDVENRCLQSFEIFRDVNDPSVWFIDSDEERAIDVFLGDDTVINRHQMFGGWCDPHRALFLRVMKDVTRLRASSSDSGIIRPNR